MDEDKIKTEEGAALWRRLREAQAPAAAPEAPDALLLAAYLDGALGEAEAARLEAHLAAEPALLDELLALRAGLSADIEEAAPAAVVTRAQALRQPRPAPRPVVKTESEGWLAGLFAAWLRPAVPAFAVLAVLLAGAGGFEMGRYQAAQLAASETTGLDDSEVPEDLLLAGLL